MPAPFLCRILRGRERVLQPALPFPGLLAPFSQKQDHTDDAEVPGRGRRGVQWRDIRFADG